MDLTCRICKSYKYSLDNKEIDIEEVANIPNSFNFKIEIGNPEGVFTNLDCYLYEVFSSEINLFTLSR